MSGVQIDVAEYFESHDDEQIKLFAPYVRGRTKKIQSLETENAFMRETVEFYAAGEKMSGYEFINNSNMKNIIGFKARNCLKKLNKGE